MKRVIITGATGAVGTALVREFIKKNIEMLILIREDSLRNQNIPEHPLIERIYCSLENFKKLENDSEKTYDVFYHLAWAGTSGAGRNDMYLQNANVKYALDAVVLAKRFGCHTFIGAGSQAEYGRAEGKLTTNTPTFPEMGYGYAKLCAGQMTRDYAHQLGMRHIWMRILSVYGPNDGEKTLIMSVLNQWKKNEIPEMTKGEQMWDYLYSGDAARAFRMVGESGVDGKVYVLGSGQARALVDYIREMRALVNLQCDVALGVIPYAPKQVMYLCADITELTEDTGWHPLTEFSDGITHILQNEDEKEW